MLFESIMGMYSIILSDIFMYNLKDWRFGSIPLPFNWPETGMYLKVWCDEQHENSFGNREKAYFSFQHH